MTGTTTYSRTDLTRRTREILESVRRGQAAVIESYGEEQAVLLDPLDYRLLLGLAGLGSGGEGRETEVQDLLRRYLENDISLAKMAGAVGLSRFELMERFERLGVPLRTGPADLLDAREEVAAARSHK